MEPVDFLAETLPKLIGLATVYYIAWRIFNLRATYFKLTRNWLFVLFVCALAALWVVGLSADVAQAEGGEAQAGFYLCFVVFVMWLSVSTISMVTTHRFFDAVAYFKTWFREHPVNVISVAGAAAITMMAIVLLVYANPDLEVHTEDWLIGLVLAFAACVSIVDLAVPLAAARSGRLPKADSRSLVPALMLSAAWLGIPLSVLLLGVLLEMRFEYDGPNPLSWVTALLFVGMVVSIVRSRSTAIAVRPEAEPTKREGFRHYDIPRGAYLVEDDRSNSAFELFAELVSLPLRPDAQIPGKEQSATATLEYLIPRGLVVTREYPDKVREQFGLQVTPIVWLTESPGEQRMAPTSLALITDTLVRFMESNPNSIVLLEGIEYIVTFNEFRKVAKSLDLLNEVAWIAKARLLIAVHPKALDEKDLALLERDRLVLRGKPAIEELKRESRIQV